MEIMIQAQKSSIQSAPAGPATDLIQKSALEGEDGNQTNQDYEPAEPRKETTTLDHSYDGDFTSSLQAPTQLVSFAPHSQFTCTSKCECRCHAKPWLLRSPDWASDIVGAWGATYVPASIQGECNCRRDGYISGVYSPPKWPWLKILFSQPSYSLKYALRPVRVLPPSDPVWNRIKAPLEMLPYATALGGKYFPDDEDQNGRTIVQRVLKHENYALLERLLVEWASLLPQQKLSRVIGYIAHWNMGAQHSGQILHTLQQLMLYVEEPPVHGITALHRAAACGRGVEAAIEKAAEISCLDDLDDNGLAPLHLACMYGHAHAARQLVDAGASINVKTIDGGTPLMLSVSRRRVECIQYLLEAKCRVNEPSKGGATALHYAARDGFPIAINLLLQNGACPSARDTQGRTPFQHLPLCNLTDLHSFQNAVRLLHGADPLGPHRGNAFGHTSLYQAVKHANIPMLHYLITNSESLHVWSGQPYNFFHCVAVNANSDVLDFLINISESLTFENVDINLHDVDHRTPWELFAFRIHNPHLFLECAPPDRHQIRSFIDFFKPIRDRSLQFDVTRLQEVLEQLSSDQDSVQTARSSLASAANRKLELTNGELAAWYRGVEKQLSVGQKDAAIDQIQDYIQDLEYELGSCLWNQIPPQYRPPTLLLDSEDETDYELTEHSEPEDDDQPFEGLPAQSPSAGHSSSFPQSPCTIRVMSPVPGKLF